MWQEPHSPSSSFFRMEPDQSHLLRMPVGMALLFQSHPGGKAKDSLVQKDSPGGSDV